MLLMSQWKFSFLPLSFMQQNLLVSWTFEGLKIFFLGVLWYLYLFLCPMRSSPHVLVNLATDRCVWNHLVSNILANLSSKTLVSSLIMHSSLDLKIALITGSPFSLQAANEKNWFVHIMVHLFDMASGQIKLEMALSVE